MQKAYIRKEWPKYKYEDTESRLENLKSAQRKLAIQILWQLNNKAKKSTEGEEHTAKEKSYHRRDAQMD